ncbi:MAG TPA: hypothetical protein VG096_20045 [Bryobacteraceae bacterium]|jgi:hypothetical protein|nr:hypothetical protein [Bryobacteraceae bacterium]
MKTKTLVNDYRALSLAPLSFDEAVSDIPKGKPEPPKKARAKAKRKHRGADLCPLKANGVAVLVQSLRPYS